MLKGAQWLKEKLTKEVAPYFDRKPCIREGLADIHSFCGRWFFELSGLRPSFVVASPSI